MLTNYQREKFDQYSLAYSGKQFSQMDRTEQLMFIVHKNNILAKELKMSLEDIERNREAIRTADTIFQSLKAQYLETLKIAE
jgi:hypothetical protein